MCGRELVVLLEYLRVLRIELYALLIVVLQVLHDEHGLAQLHLINIATIVPEIGVLHHALQLVFVLGRVIDEHIEEQKAVFKERDQQSIVAVDGPRFYLKHQGPVLADELDELFVDAQVCDYLLD